MEPATLLGRRPPSPASPALPPTLAPLAGGRDNHLLRRRGAPVAGLSPPPEEEVPESTKCSKAEGAPRSNTKAIARRSTPSDLAALGHLPLEGRNGPKHKAHSPEPPPQAASYESQNLARVLCTLRDFQ